MADRKPLKKGGVLSRSWKRVLGGFRRHKSSADGDARRSAQAEPPPRRAVSLNKAALADAERRNVVPEDSPKWLKSLVKDGDAALAELPTLPSTDGIEGLGGSFGSGDGLSRDSESTERSSSMSSRGTRPLEVQRGLSTTGRVPRVASAELEAFVEAGVAPPSTPPPRQRVVRFNSVVDDSEPGTPPPDS